MIDLVLVGSPNAGKTTLYNWLTGSKFKTVNYAGSTIDYCKGKTLSQLGEVYSIIDTPGLRSLEANSPDEEITTKILCDQSIVSDKTLLVVPVDATQLSRHLVIVKQLQDSGFNIVVALTMVDLAISEGVKIDSQKLSQKMSCPVVEIDGRLGGGVKELLNSLKGVEFRTAQPKIRVWNKGELENLYTEMDKIVEQVCVKKDENKKHFALKRTAQIDRFLLHPLLGYLFFISVMLGLFTSIFWLAAPLMDLVDEGFAASVDITKNLLGNGLFASLISDGLIAGVGAVLVFVPQIFILFLGMSFLEDSGYLARAASLVDRPLRAIGLGGRSFVPLLSGYACAIPAMLAARTIRDKGERSLALFIIPLMSCSARLPVFAILLGFLFFGESAWKPGLALAGIFVVGLLIAGIVSRIAMRWVPKEGKSWFMLELPAYRRPHFRVLLRSSLSRTFSYIKKAGPTIIAVSVALWVFSTFPNHNLESEAQVLETSYVAQVGKTIEPIFKPMGLDWRVGVGLMTAFAAREVFVTSLVLMFRAEGNEEELEQSLIGAMAEAKFADGSPIFTLSSVIGLILFFIVALQCFSTVVVAQKESGSWGFALAQMSLFLVLAYGLAVITVQGLRAVGVA